MGLRYREFGRIEDAGPEWELVEVIYRDEVQTESLCESRGKRNGMTVTDNRQQAVVVRQPVFLMKMNDKDALGSLRKALDEREDEVRQLKQDTKNIQEALNQSRNDVKFQTEEKNRANARIEEKEAELVNLRFKMGPATGWTSRWARTPSMPVKYRVWKT